MSGADLSRRKCLFNLLALRPLGQVSEDEKYYYCGGGTAAAAVSTAPAEFRARFERRPNGGSPRWDHGPSRVGQRHLRLISSPETPVGSSARFSGGRVVGIVGALVFVGLALYDRFKKEDAGLKDVSFTAGDPLSPIDEEKDLRRLLADRERLVRWLVEEGGWDTAAAASYAGINEIAREIGALKVFESANAVRASAGGASAMGAVQPITSSEIEAERKRGLQLVEDGKLEEGVTALFNLSVRARSADFYELAAELGLDQAFAIQKKYIRGHVSIRGLDYHDPRREDVHNLDVSGRFYDAAELYIRAAETVADFDARMRLYMRANEAGRLCGYSYKVYIPAHVASGISREMELAMKVAGFRVDFGVLKYKFEPGHDDAVREFMGPRLAETFLRDMAKPVSAPTTPSGSARRTDSKPLRVPLPASVNPRASAKPAVQRDAVAYGIFKKVVHAQKITGQDIATLADQLGPRAGGYVSARELKEQITYRSGSLFNAFAELVGRSPQDLADSLRNVRVVK